MRNFYRDHLEFSQCGLNCLLCPMHLGGYCPGCGGGDGCQGCSIARCAMKQGVEEFCTQCGQFPCRQYERMLQYDSFIPHSRILRDLERAQELGPEVYITELRGWRAVLDQLLAGWNDGRRKSFYCLAVYLLEWEDLQRAFGEIQAAAPVGIPIKEKAFMAVEILKRTAQASGVVLKLNKKPKEK